MLRRLNHLLFVAVLAFCAFAHAETLQGRVVGVTDGDTVTLLDRANTQYKIRLSGIDSPEKNQPFGQRAKQSLSDLAFDRYVTAECTKRDRYGRSICKLLDGSRDINLEQIRGGMAWWYRHYASEQPAEDRATYEQAETHAKRGRVGLWVDHDPVPPWDWRRASKR